MFALRTSSTLSQIWKLGNTMRVMRTFGSGCGHHCGCGGNHGSCQGKDDCDGDCKNEECSHGKENQPSGESLLKVLVITNGSYRENAYLVWDSDQNTGVLIDPGEEDQKIKDAIETNSINVDKILLTHGHHDHCSCIPQLLNAMGEIPVYMHENDMHMLKKQEKEMSELGLKMILRGVRDGDRIRVGSRIGEAIHTPGHTRGSMCYKFGSFLFSGDTLFQGSIGRTDLPGGDSRAIIDSIKKKLFCYNPQVRVLCGHGGVTTLGEEMRDNPFVGSAN